MTMELRRRESDEERAMREVLLGAGVDLQIGAKAMADQAAAIAQLALGLAPDGILQSETIALDNAGMYALESHVPAHSIAVVNLGSTVLTVSNSGLASSPPGPGRGTLKVLPGHAVCVPLLGLSHAFWGRPGERVTVVRYKTLQPFSASDVGGSYLAAPLPSLTIGTPTVVYSTPWGDPAYYGGLEVADTFGPIGTSDVTEMIITDGNGVEVDRVNLAGGESTEDSHARATLTTSPDLVATLVKGSLAGALRVW